MSVAIRAMECFVSAIVFGIAPIAFGFILGWIMRKEKYYEYLKALIIRLDNEGKLLDGEKEKLLKAVDELKEESDGK